MRILDYFREDTSYWVKFRLDRPYEPILFIDVIAKSKSEAKDKAIDKALYYYGIGLRAINLEEIIPIRKGSDIRYKQYICFVNGSWKTSGTMEDCLSYISKYADDQFDTVLIEPKSIKAE